MSSGTASSLLNVLRQAGPVLGGAVVGLLIQVLAAAPTDVDPLGLSRSTVASVLTVPLLLFFTGLFVYSSFRGRWCRQWTEVVSRQSSAVHSGIVWKGVSRGGCTD